MQKPMRSSGMQFARVCALWSLIATASVVRADPTGATVTFRLPAAPAGVPLTGRLLLLLSTDPSDEPRNQISASADSQFVFGTDIEHTTERDIRVPVDKLRGYPLHAFGELPAAEYNVQAVLHRYETVHRADGFTLALPMDRGEGQRWNRAPGNLFSKPIKLRVHAGASLEVTLDQVMPAIAAPKDTAYVRHVTIQSKLLSAFWGRPMFLTAHVLLPAGFDSHPDARFPIMISQDHFRGDFPGFRTQPPDRSTPAGDATEEREAYAFYQRWIAPDFPRFLVVYIDHPNPYYDDSYGVDSPNLGPYGRAIHSELIPEIEHRFHAIGAGWARFTYGGSTGGWEALAALVANPDFYNGAFVACPDPIDFRGMTNFDIYETANAYYLDGKHQRILQPGQQDANGRTLSTLKANNDLELALGSHGRSGEQWDIWFSAFGPVGPDGYPKPLFDRQTGVIDRDVARYWHEHSDLSVIVQRNWPVLGPKLRGKIHLYVGTSDSFFLANGVHYFEDMLKQLDHPSADAEVSYGLRFEHCWNGDPTLPNDLSRLRYHTMYLSQILERMQKTAPKAADLTSWRY